MRLFLRKLKTASSFSLTQWKIILWAYYFLIKTRFLLLFFPSRMVEKTLLRSSKKDTPKSVPSDFEKEFLRSFRIAWRYQFGKPKCLATSLAEHALLSRYGFPARFHIGIRKENGRLCAHAWVENQTGSQEKGYAVMEAVEEKCLRSINRD